LVDVECFNVDIRALVADPRDFVVTKSVSEVAAYLRVALKSNHVLMKFFIKEVHTNVHTCGHEVTALAKSTLSTLGKDDLIMPC